MRGIVAHLPSPHPLAAALPAVYQEEDAFAVGLTSALDEVLAPVLASLDNLSAYFTPSLAPEDFVDWLAGWVGIELDETWSLDRRRALVQAAADLHGRRGTASGLADQVRIATGGEIEIIENGASAWSVDAGGSLPGTARPALHVRVRVPDPAAVDNVRLERLVASSKPAHVPHRIEVLAQDAPAGGRRRQRADASDPAAPSPEAGPADTPGGAPDAPDAHGEPTDETPPEATD